MAMANSEKLIPVRLYGVQYAARDVRLFEFRRLDDKTLPPVTAGSHVDVHLPNGLVRQYSMTRPDAAPKNYVIAVKKEPASKGGSKALFDDTQVGDIVHVGPPRNHFQLDETATHTVLLAGGIGITPIWCMVQRLSTLARSWELHYCARTRSYAAFLPELIGMQNVHLHFDDEHSGQLMDLAGIIRDTAPNAHYYCCGPLPMLRAFEEVTAALPPDRVHVEYFLPRQSGQLNGGYTVEIASGGQSFEIQAGQSILTTLCNAGFNLPFSCQEGTCGACETSILYGIPDHRDSVLSATERAAGKTMMICVSGSLSPKLVLDL